MKLNRVMYIIYSLLFLFTVTGCSSLVISESTSERMVAIKNDGSPALYPIRKTFRRSCQNQRSQL